MNSAEMKVTRFEGDVVTASGGKAVNLYQDYNRLYFKDDGDPMSAELPVHVGDLYLYNDQTNKYNFFGSLDGISEDIGYIPVNGISNISTVNDLVALLRDNVPSDPVEEYRLYWRDLGGNNFIFSTTQ